jgi:hypothetical protein
MLRQAEEMVLRLRREVRESAIKATVDDMMEQDESEREAW